MDDNFFHLTKWTIICFKTKRDHQLIYKKGPSNDLQIMDHQLISKEMDLQLILKEIDHQLILK
jgi:hypothetical protein